MKKYFLLLLLFIATTTSAQRWYAINDSTSYSYQGIDITVGRNKVYRNLNNTLTLIRDFSTSNPNSSEDYIRDFDFIDEDSWFVLVGSRYIGQTTELYKTDDAGLTWQIMTPQSFTVPSNLDGVAASINQVQFLNGRIYLFDAYYTSRVFYSDDLGQTWILWFQSLPAHYYQIFPCGTDLYLHGLVGDAITPYMFKIPATVYGIQNYVGIISYCYNCCGNPGCYYPSPPTIVVPEVYNYFKNLVDNTICNALDTNENTINEITAYPNPVINSISLEGINTTIPFSISVYNSLGQKCLEDKNKLTIDLTSFKSGIYFMKVTQNKITKTIKVVKQ